MNRRSAEIAAFALFVVGLVALVVAVRDSLGDAADEIADADRWKLVAAFLLVLGGRGALALAAWVAAARELSGVTPRVAVRAWTRATVGKYLPGVVWQPLGLVEYLRQGGAGAGAAASVLAVDGAATIVSGLVVGFVAIPGLAAEQGASALWLLLALPLLVLLHPRAFAAGLGLVERVTGREHGLVAPSWSLILRLVSLNAAGWAAAGVSLWLVLSALGTTPSPALVVPAAALSWVAGFLFVIAPAGLGVREAALVALLATATTTEAALAAAVLSRLMFVGMDVLAAAAGGFVGAPRAAERPEVGAPPRSP